MFPLILLCVFTLSAGFVIYIKQRDKRLWNDGKCKCGGEWKFFGLTAAGSRIYKCEYCDDDIIISDLE